MERGKYPGGKKCAEQPAPGTDSLDVFVDPRSKSRSRRQTEIHRTQG